MMTLRTGHFCLPILSVLLLISVSCDRSGFDETQPEKGMGKVVLKSVETVSETDDYNFRFVGVDGYGTSPYYRYSDVKWPMTWYYGIFRLQAESCTLEEAEAGYGRLRYEGISAPFSVINNQTATASVVCSIANCRVDVTFNDKMFLSYKDFKLKVDSVLAPVYETDEDGNTVEVRGEQLLRTLDFTTLYKTGYYNLHQDSVFLKYTLYVMLDGAEEYMEQATGYFYVKDSDEPAVVKPADYITFNVSYVGDVAVTDGVKFIIGTERKAIPTGITIPDYSGAGSVTEDE